PQYILTHTHLHTHTHTHIPQYILTHTTHLTRTEQASQAGHTGVEVEQELINRNTHTQTHTLSHRAMCSASLSGDVYLIMKIIDYEDHFSLSHTHTHQHHT